jgi:hypothetical protein
MVPDVLPADSDSSVIACEESVFPPVVGFIGTVSRDFLTPVFFYIKHLP